MSSIVAAALAVATVVVGVGAGTDFTTVAVSDLSALLAAGVGLVATATVAGRSTGRHGWGWLAAAFALWLLGEVLWTLWEVGFGHEVPYPSVADVAYLAAVPFAVVGILRFVPRGGVRFGLRSVLDACVVACSTLFVGWAVALGPAVRGTEEPVLSQAVSIAYPLTDVVLAALALLVLHWGGATARRPLALVAGGFVVMAVADSAFTWMINQGTYSGDALVTMLWPASYLLIAAGAQVEARSPAVEPSWRATVAALVLPYLPLAAAFAVAAHHAAGGDPLGPFLTVLGAALVALVLLRQAVLAWDLRSTVEVLHAREAELARLALTDALTGLANRVRFVDRLETAVATLPHRPAVIYIDLDGFKAVNDRLGHAAGDRLLVEAAARLEAATSGSMLVARLGGDEFVVLVEDGLDRAVIHAQLVLDAFTVPFELDGESIRIQASVGVAAAPEDGSPEEAVRRADAAMYVAKSTGKGRAVAYPDETIVAM